MSIARILANSVRFALPRITAPASRKSFTTVASPHASVPTDVLQPRWAEPVSFTWSTPIAALSATVQPGAPVGTWVDSSDPMRTWVQVGDANGAGLTSGQTYTVDTLRDLHAEYPDDQLFFITGADALEQILTWRNADELFTFAHFIGVTRPGYRLNSKHLPNGKVSLVEVTAMAISSTACRERVQKGEPVWYLVPDGVVRYIDKRKLYSCEGPRTKQVLLP